MSTSSSIASAFRAACDSQGWIIEPARESGGDVVTISKRIPPEDTAALTLADTEYGTLLAMLPRTSAGSLWGTDCGGIGALSALRSGVFRMHKSGVSRRVVAALAKSR